MFASRPGSGYGNGRSNNASPTLKIALKGQPEILAQHAHGVAAILQ